MCTLTDVDTNEPKRGGCAVYCASASKCESEKLITHKKTKNTQNGHILARKVIVKILETCGKCLDNGPERA